MSTPDDDGGPAFPQVRSTALLSDSCARIETTGGMSTLDVFAAHVMGGMAVQKEGDGDYSDWNWDGLADDAYVAARALLRARKRARQ